MAFSYGNENILYTDKNPPLSKLSPFTMLQYIYEENQINLLVSLLTFLSFFDLLKVNTETTSQNISKNKSFKNTFSKWQVTTNFIINNYMYLVKHVRKKIIKNIYSVSVIPSLPLSYCNSNNNRNCCYWQYWSHLKI